MKQRCLYWLLCGLYLNPFQFNVPFLYILKTSKKFCDIFSGYISGQSGQNRLMVLWIYTHSKSTLKTICSSVFIVDFEQASVHIGYILNTTLCDHQVNSNASTRYSHHFNKNFHSVLYSPQNIPANRYEIHCVTIDR